MLNFESYFLSEATEGAKLYHCTDSKLKIGQVIRYDINQFGDKYAGSPVAMRTMEYILEEARKKLRPDSPSRQDCIYCSIIPDSAFSERGKIYEVRPIGKVFYTNARIIDKMGERIAGMIVSIESDKDVPKNKLQEEIINRAEWDMTMQHLISQYWKQRDNYGYNGENIDEVKWIEALCDGVEIIKDTLSDSL